MGKRLLLLSAALVLFSVHSAASYPPQNTLRERREHFGAESMQSQGKESVTGADKAKYAPVT